jgi:hypothetical protein
MCLRSEEWCLNLKLGFEMGKPTLTHVAIDVVNAPKAINQLACVRSCLRTMLIDDRPIGDPDQVVDDRRRQFAAL